MKNGKKQEKQETQESKYSKAQISSTTLVENIMLNLEKGIESRLNQQHLQNIKKYYKEEYRHFFEFSNLFYGLLASFLAYAFLPDLFDNPYQIFGILIISLIFLRYMYDDNKSTFVYLQKMIGDFALEKVDEEEDKKESNINVTAVDIVRYLEKKVFGKLFIINYKMYFILTIFSLTILTIGYYIEDERALMILPIFSFAILFDFLFIKESKKYKSSKNDNR